MTAIESTHALIGYLEHADPSRHNTIGIWCTHCCTWHLHRVTSMTPDRVARVPVKCKLPAGPHRDGNHLVWSGDTPLHVAQAVRTEPTPEQRAIIDRHSTTPDIDKMRRSTISQPVRVNADAIGWNCDPADPGPSGEPVQSCALYWHYDRTGRLLYIGISDELTRRGRDHRATSTWAVFVASSRAAWFPNRPAALLAEKAAIAAEQPIFNRQHNTAPDADGRVHAYLAEHGRLDLLPERSVNGDDR